MESSHIKCPQCGTKNPETVIKGIGPEAIRCANCGADATPFIFTNGYTMFFGEKGDVGLTLPQEAAETIAEAGRFYMNTPEASVQNPVVTFAPHDLVGVELGATGLRIVEVAPGVTLDP